MSCPSGSAPSRSTTLYSRMPHFCAITLTGAQQRPSSPPISPASKSGPMPLSAAQPAPAHTFSVTGQPVPGPNWSHAQSLRSPTARKVIISTSIWWGVFVSLRGKARAGCAGRRATSAYKRRGCVDAAAFVERFCCGGHCSVPALCPERPATLMALTDAPQCCGPIAANEVPQRPEIGTWEW